jgi:hypothetical protein
MIRARKIVQQGLGFERIFKDDIVAPDHRKTLAWKAEAE